MVGRLYGMSRARGDRARRASCSSASTSPTPPAGRRRRTRAACAAAWTSARRSSPSRRSCSSTSRRPAWTRAAASSCGRRSRSSSPRARTVLLTTQYLDEADRLADTIAVIDHGRVIAEGTPDELKDRVGGERLEVRLTRAAPTRRRRCAALAPMSDEPPHAEGDTVTVGVRRRTGVDRRGGAPPRRGGRRRRRHRAAPADARRRVPVAHRPRGRGRRRRRAARRRPHEPRW